MTKPFARAWTAAGALWMAALFLSGAAMAQTRPAVPDDPASPLLRQGTIEEQDLTGSEPKPAPPAGETVSKTPAVTGTPTWPGPAARIPGRESEGAAAPRAGTTALAPRRGPAVQAPTVPATGSDAPSDRGTGDSYPLPDLAAVVGSGVPQREASMKLLQQGQALLRAERHEAALARFEQGIRVDSSNPYSHYFVARAHYFLGNYRESLNFLEVAESGLAVDDRWLAEVYVLRARSATALGFHARADLDYVRALEIQPFHGYALARLTTIEPAARANRTP
ncbi:MAG: hypothetical protein OXF11_05850 [Deltaproteobacteria bacterium]|nr:hypothetical protein [Deltaproteobacteria bacterium]